MISTQEVFDRMKRYRRERNQLRQEMEKLKGLPQKVLVLQQQVAKLEKQVQDFSTKMNLEELKHELSTEFDHKIENILSQLPEDSSSNNFDNEEVQDISGVLDSDMIDSFNLQESNIPQILG